MLNPKDITDHKNLSKEQQRALEKQMQQNDLSYLSSVAFEQFNVSGSEIDKLHQLIDKGAVSRNYKQFNTVFISVLCGLLIGVSIFFVIFHKNQTHQSVYQNLNEEPANNTLNNAVASVDTVFPTINYHETTAPTEHFNTIADVSENAIALEVPDMLPTKPLKLPETNDSENEELILQFIPNAPVVFISNLKVTNYHLYYFKRSEGISLSVNTGLEAQYENNSNIERTVLNKSDSYMAHKIIQHAMKLFNSKNYANCIEELNMLYTFNSDDANAQFYLGMCYYNTGKFVYAQSYFQKNLDGDNNIFHQESEFYQAMCLLNTKQSDKAMAQLQNIVNNKGFYSTRAQEVLNKQK